MAVADNQPARQPGPDGSPYSDHPHMNAGQPDTSNPASINKTAAKIPAKPGQKKNTTTDMEQAEKALSFMREGNYAIAYCIWKPMSDADNATAQFNLGWMYHNGYGLAIDNIKARGLWQKAALQGHTEASFTLGLLLYHGDESVRPDIPAASTFFQVAAMQGHSDARNMLAYLLKQNPAQMASITSKWGTEQWKLVGKSVRIKVQKANTRSKPSVKSAVLYVLDNNTRIVAISRNKRWVQVYIPGKERLAWVFDSLIMPATNPAGLTAPDIKAE